MAAHTLKPSLLSLLLILSSTSYAAINDAGIKTKWGYKGDIAPKHWGALNKEFELCAQGKSQSPIDIPKSTAKQDHRLTVEYLPEAFAISHDGDMHINIGKQQIVTNEGHTIQVRFEGPTAETITYAGARYQLNEFHFHSPSETTLQHRDFPLEIHFVHQGPHGQAAVIAVFVSAGEENKELQKIIENLPHDIGQEHSVSGLKLNPKNLLPNTQNYYHFQGSLTTPPCTEGLEWLVLEEPISASSAQIQQLRHAIGGDNNRPVQPLNGRSIAYSAERK